MKKGEDMNKLDMKASDVFTISYRGESWKNEISLPSNRHKHIEKVGIDEYCQSKSSNVLDYVRQIKYRTIYVGRLRCSKSSRIKTAYCSASYINSVKYRGEYNCNGLLIRSGE